jgi:hypothetical protein
LLSEVETDPQSTDYLHAPFKDMPYQARHDGLLIQPLTTPKQAAQKLFLAAC